MAYLDIKNIKIRGVVSCLPPKVVENSEYDVIPLEERQKFIDAVGISRHRVADRDVCTSDLCYHAAEELIKRISWNKDDIQLIVFVSQTPDYKMPSTSCLLQERLGLSKSTMTIDVSQGCSGYLYGIGIMGSLMQTGCIRKGLLLVGNTQLKNTNYQDKSVYPLFSDAGSATAFEYTESDGDRFRLSYATDGSGEHTIIIPDGGYRNPVNSDSFIEKEYEGGIKRNNLNIAMHGDDVFSFVISNIPRYTKDLFQHFDVNKESIDYFLLHHASKFIIKKLIKKLQLPEERTPLVLNDYGNLSNATIPVLMSSIKEQICNKNLNLYLTGFGVGLSLGVGIISVGHLVCADIIEYKK